MSHGSNALAAPFDVALVGYGPVGATLANLLGQGGLSVVVFDREPRPYPLPRAVHFDDEVMRIFQAVGLAEAIEPDTRVSPGMRFVDADGRLLIDWSRPVAEGTQGWSPSYRFHQPDLERTLRAGLARWTNVTVRTRCEVFALDESEDDVHVRFEDLAQGRLEQVRARYVVGCDGARSLVRRLIGSQLEDLGFHERWLVVDCLLKRDVPGLGEHSVQHCEADRPATYVRGTGNRRRWELTALPGEADADLIQPANIWSLLARWITPEDADLERFAVYTFHSVLARQWRRGRLVIAGDAAHQTPPFLGQGMCAGIRDAATLAWKLSAVLRKGATDALLDSYTAERSPHVRAYIELAVRLGGLINTQATDAALAGSTSAPGTPMAMRSIKPRLGIDLPADAHPLLGTLAPQPRLAGGERLDDRVGYRFALVTKAAEPAWDPAWDDDLAAADIAVLRGASEVLDAWLGSAEAALVRPDRYVAGVAASPGEVADLVARSLDRSLGRNGVERGGLAARPERVGIVIERPVIGDEPGGSVQ